MPTRPDPRSGRGEYRRIADDIRGGIRSGALAPGQLLPPEPALAERYDVSLDVIRSALRELRVEGLIVTQHGRGSRVRELMEVSMVQVRPGARVTARMPTPEEREQFGLPEGTPVLVVRQGEVVEVLPADRYAVETVDQTDE